MHRISVALNRQQLELIDRSLADGKAASRAELLKQALRDYLARQPEAVRSGRPTAESQR